MGFAKIKQDIKVSLGILPHEKVPGPQWRSQGYRLEEIGPTRFEREGHEEVMAQAARIHGQEIQGPLGLTPET
ncbi:hypothetical protein EXIGLDRAFT_837909 [Exidia glandulosa HHB12029]|uniref:Uncharacterized protein n=1 Tax=Exidia glandulosa HHB12029 TaxID=1314781 RepID=A0A165GC98_EXIGL|nr:hypothetical protein EXIGLDRAFT_837909 [Exidia glandulosa HHB12029]